MATLSGLGAWAVNLVLGFLWGKVAAFISGLLAGIAARHALQKKFDQIAKTNQAAADDLKQAIAKAAAAKTDAEKADAAKDMDDAIDRDSVHF